MTTHRELGRSITIGILTASRDELLKQLIEELLLQIENSDEILVLDTASSNSTYGLVSGFLSPNIRYKSVELKPFNFAIARNLILQNATCEAVIFIDDDALPFPGWLYRARENLLGHTSTGGPTVATGPLPQWWHPGINWCIGLSSPGLILRLPGYYPDTCNLGANKSFWEQHPLPVVQDDARHIYLTGREDADWWLTRRLNGDEISIDHRQAVSHAIHADRLTLNYVKNRAELDGKTSWLRRPQFETASAIPWDLAHIVGVVLDKFVQHPRDLKSRLPDVIWMRRQWGVFKGVWGSDINLRPRHRHLIWQLLRACKFQAQIRLGAILFKVRNLFCHTRSFPPTNPKIIFVSADCHVGDTVLLRRHIQNLAVTFPHAQIIASARFPSLLTGLRENIIILTQDEAVEMLKRMKPDAAIVPYYPFGNVRMWRKHLSNIGITFDCDVGFPGRRDTIYSRKLIEKNLEVHEHENLERLFRVWPLISTPLPPPASLSANDELWVREVIESELQNKDYIVVQFGGGYPAKEWPLDCWIPFLQRFTDKADLSVVIIGANSWEHAGDEVTLQLQSNHTVLNLAGRTTLEQITALIKNAAFLIGGCSGPKHIAIMYDVPTFTLYTATEPHRWGAAENHHLHAYISALPQKLTAMELQGLPVDHRARLLDPLTTADSALHHYECIKRRANLVSAEPSETP